MLFLIVGGSPVAYSTYGYLLKHVRDPGTPSYAYVNPTVAVLPGAGPPVSSLMPPA
jgi:precorrin-2 methylase